MDNSERLANYASQNGSMVLTPAQRRRWWQKQNRAKGSKTHPHAKDERCYTCRPAKRPKVALTPQRIRAVSR